LRLTGNIHVVDPGVVYRSAQLSPSQLSSLIKQKHIRAVINLRGGKPGSAWYDEELVATRLAGAQHLDLPLSANREPDDTLVRALREMLQSTPRPFLIHCEGGADRSGLASALYELDVRQRSPEEAGRQLTFRYGHFPWLLSHTGAMDRAFWRVAASRAVGGPARADEGSRPVPGR
jgi:protein tyrosine/serine phosphatase